MVEDIEEFKKLIKEKKISTVDKMMEETKKFIEKIPNFNQKIEKVFIARGRVLEISIEIEKAFDELITKTGGEDLVINHENKRLDLVTGAVEEHKLEDFTFNTKIKKLKEIVTKFPDYRDNSISKSELLINLDRFRAIRNLFAHVPISFFSEELEFDNDPHYKKYFNLDQRWKRISFAINEFIDLGKKILELITFYVSSVVLKKKIFLTVLFGKDYKKVLEEASKKIKEKDMRNEGEKIK